MLMIFFLKLYKLVQFGSISRSETSAVARPRKVNARIEEVIAFKESLISERKELMHDKMAKAEAKRQEHIGKSNF